MGTVRCKVQGKKRNIRVPFGRIPFGSHTRTCMMSKTRNDVSCHFATLTFPLVPLRFSVGNL